MKANKLFMVTGVAFCLIFSACDDSGSGSNSGRSCTVSHTETTLTVHQSIDGAGTYDVTGVLGSSGGIYNSYKEYYVSSADAEKQCKKIKAEDWYSDIVCTGNTITYTDYNETTIAEEAADFQDMCDNAY